MIALASPLFTLAALVDELRLAVPPGVELAARMAKVSLVREVRRWLA